MPPPSAKPRVTLAGVVVGFVGFAVAAYAWTGERAYDLAFLYVALAGSVLMVSGVGVAGYGRAMKGGGRARSGKARGAKAVKAAKADKPAAAAQPKAAKLKLALPKRSKPQGPPDLEAARGELWPVSAREGAESASAVVAQAPAEKAEAKGKRKRLALPLRKKKDAPATQKLSGLEDETGELWPASLRPEPAGEGEAQRFELKCPECAMVFPAEGTPPLQVRCPGCGADGTVG